MLTDLTLSLTVLLIVYLIIRDWISKLRYHFPQRKRHGETETSLIVRVLIDRPSHMK